MTPKVQVNNVESHILNKYVIVCFISTGIFDVELVKHQIKYLGLMENLRVRRAGFAYRRVYERFLRRYKCLSKETWPNYHGNAKDGVQILACQLGYEKNDYQMGK